VIATRTASPCATFVRYLLKTIGVRKISQAVRTITKV
jgi:hypothetical protein